MERFLQYHLLSSLLFCLFAPINGAEDFGRSDVWRHRSTATLYPYTFTSLILYSSSSLFYKIFAISKALSWSKILRGSERPPLPPWRLNDVFLLRCKLLFCKISTVTRYDLTVPFNNFIKSPNEFVQTLGSKSTRNRIKRFPGFPQTLSGLVKCLC